MPSFSVLRGVEVFYFPPCSGLSTHNPRAKNLCAARMKDQKMKKFCLILMSVSAFAASSMAQTDLFSSIQDWVGTGDNEAAFEIDWNNGTANDTLIWGYRWDGTATGEQMFDAIVAADPRLYAEIS